MKIKLYCIIECREFDTDITKNEQIMSKIIEREVCMIPRVGDMITIGDTGLEEEIKDVIWDSDLFNAKVVLCNCIIYEDEGEDYKDIIKTFRDDGWEMF